MYSFLAETGTSAPEVTSRNAALVKATEAKYNISFPEELKEYYTQYDGRKIKLCVFQAKNNEYEVSKIIPLGGDGLTFGKIVDNDREDGFISPCFYPLAANRGGDVYYWDTDSQSVFLIYADDVERPRNICQSVSAFFELLSRCFR